MQPTRILVAGAGMIGRAHVEWIAGEPGAVLAGLVDPAPAARDLAERLGVPHFVALEAALAALSRTESRWPRPTLSMCPRALRPSPRASRCCWKSRSPIPWPARRSSSMRRRRLAFPSSSGITGGTAAHRRGAGQDRRGRTRPADRRPAMCLFRKPDAGYFDGPGAWRREPGGGVVLINLIHVVDDLRNLCGEVAERSHGVPRRPRLPRRGHGGGASALSQRRVGDAAHLRRRGVTLELGTHLGREQELPEDRSALLLRGRDAGLPGRAEPGKLEPSRRRLVSPIRRERVSTTLPSRTP